MATAVHIPDVTDSELAFGTCVGLPRYSDIPEEFKGRSRWNKLFSDWFFGGLKSLTLTPRDGVDGDKAKRHLRAIMRSFQSKHEHKEAGFAYLADQYFSDAQWEKQ
jgi:hypothetical protein